MSRLREVAPGILNGKEVGPDKEEATPENLKGLSSESGFSDVPSVSPVGEALPYRLSQGYALPPQPSPAPSRRKPEVLPGQITQSDVVAAQNLERKRAELEDFKTGKGNVPVCVLDGGGQGGDENKER